MVKAKVLDVDIEKERIAWHQAIDKGPFAQANAFRETITCTVTTVSDNSLDVSVGDSMTGFIRRADLSRERAEQRSDRFAVGEKVDATVTNVDKKTRKLTLSIKARETAEEKQAMAITAHQTVAQVLATSWAPLWQSGTQTTSKSFKNKKHVGSVVSGAAFLRLNLCIFIPRPSKLFKMLILVN